MSNKNVIKIICDYCNYESHTMDTWHPNEWLWISINTMVNKNNYINTERYDSSGDFCPTCYKIYGKDKLISYCKVKK